MRISVKPSRALIAAVLIRLGIIGLVNGDFALVWQGIPINHVSSRQTVASFCAVIELAAGVGLLLRPTATLSCGVLFPSLMLWVALLKLPGLVPAQQLMRCWGAFGEIAIILAGGRCLFAAHAGTWEKLYLKSKMNFELHFNLPFRVTQQ